MPRPSNKEQRRSEIMNALLKVMSREGYSKASIQEIAKEAGLASGLIHHHFSNKQEILLMLVEDIRARVKKRFESIKKENSSPLELIEALIDAKLARGEGEDLEAVKAWVVIGAESVRQKEVQEVYSTFIKEDMQFMMKQLKEYKAELSLKSRKEIAAGIIAFMEGAYQISAAASEVVPKGFAAKFAKKLLLDLDNKVN